MKTKGFTLIELLVVIAILAVLATAVVLVLNPAELVRQGRDSTRMSDLAALNSAIALWLSDVSTTSWSAVSRCTYSTSDSSTCRSTSSPTLVTSTAVDGTGWVNLNFNAISSGAPFSKLPIDPNNGATACRTSGGSTSTCQYSFYTSPTMGIYELDAAMESVRYSNGGGSDVVSKDGGNNSYLYEVGSNLSVW